MTSFISTIKQWLQPRTNIKESLDPKRCPKHVAIIMDGNGRWAKRRGLPRLAGHRAGAKAIHEVVEISPSLGIEYLTLYTFSTENWSRPEKEVSGLMTLFREMLEAELDNLHRSNVRLKVIGDLDGMDKATVQKFKEALIKTNNNTGLTLIIALNYSGRGDILRAVKKTVKEGLSDVNSVDHLTEADFTKNLSTSDIPDPALVIRSSGELRLSNFLIWESAYSEFWVTKKLWPDFCKQDLIEAVSEFQQRNRRFGGLAD